MGRICEYACPSCGAAWKIHAGHGMRHAVLENVLDAFPEETREKIAADTKGEPIPSFEFNYLPAVCLKCQKVTSAAAIYIHRTGQTYLSACPDCGEALSVSAKNTEFLCPRCKTVPLSVREIGNWD